MARRKASSPRPNGVPTFNKKRAGWLMGNRIWPHLRADMMEELRFDTQIETQEIVSSIRASLGPRYE